MGRLISDYDYYCTPLQNISIITFNFTFCCLYNLLLLACFKNCKYCIYFCKSLYKLCSRLASAPCITALFILSVSRWFGLVPLISFSSLPFALLLLFISGFMVLLIYWSCYCFYFCLLVCDSMLMEYDGIVYSCLYLVLLIVYYCTFSWIVPAYLCFI